jgi:CubicO group peptidase (beta-lactamase class C family)
MLNVNATRHRFAARGARLVFVPLILGLLLSACATPPAKPEQMARGDYSYTERYLRWFIPREMRRVGVPGLSIALVDDQRVVWAQGFGYADAERKRPAGVQTLYGIGSISKLFTATAVMQQVEQGHLDLDAPVSQYLPDFSLRTRYRASGPITTRNLLTHHAGLPGDRLKGMWSLHPAPFEQVFPLLRDEYVSYPPDLVFSYSNLGYALLGRLVEKASGQSYLSYMQDALLTPLGMDHTRFLTEPLSDPQMAVGYRQGQPGAERYLLREVPAGALVSNVADMSRFIRLWLADGRAGTRVLVGSEALREMWRRQNADVALDMDFRIGLGWMLGLPGLDYAGPVVHHNGGTLGAASELIVLPQHKLGVIVLANSAAASAALNTIAVQTLKLALEAKAGLREPPASTPVAPPALTTNTASLAPWAGAYAGNLGAVFMLRNKGDYLQTRFLGRTMALLPRADGTFAVQYRLFGWLPMDFAGLRDLALSLHTVGDRQVVALHYKGQRTLAGMKISPHPVSPAWRARTGRYVIVNKGDDGTLFEDMQLAYENGLLVLKYTLPEAPGFTPSLALDPVSDTQAVSLGLGRFMGETFRVINVEGQERIAYSGYILRRE